MTWCEYLEALKAWIERNPEAAAMAGGPTNPNDPPPPPPKP